jgi:hypothetical protein
MIIPVIGPPKAGMTPAVQYLWLHDLVPSVDCKDLDGILGTRHRSHGERAIALLDGWVKAPPAGRLIVDVGAAQLLAPQFVSYVLSLPDYPSSVAVMWCDEATSCRRHGNASDVRPYYTSTTLVGLWDAARAAGRVVDTSGDESPERWAKALARVVGGILKIQGDR